MNEELIKNYARLMKELELTALEITEEGRTIRLEKGSGFAAVPQAAVMQEQVRESFEDNIPDTEKITSPMVGVFYEAPAENAEPFVKVGDRVKKGDTLCIIEAMKLMNEVTAERDGTIAEICVKNAQTVEFGTVLFHITD